MTDKPDETQSHEYVDYSGYCGVCGQPRESAVHLSDDVDQHGRFIPFEPPHQPAGPPEWQPIFDEVGYDIMDIVMDFQHGRKSAGETMDRISDFALAAYRHRADLTHADAIRLITEKRDEWQALKSKEVKRDPVTPTVDYYRYRDQILAANELLALLEEKRNCPNCPHQSHVGACIGFGEEFCPCEEK